LFTFTLIEVTAPAGAFYQTSSTLALAADGFWGGWSLRPDPPNRLSPLEMQHPQVSENSFSIYRPMI
jgi:hypothetical protein